MWVPFSTAWAGQWAPKSTSNQHEIDVESMHVSRPQFERQMEPFWVHFGAVSRSSCYASIEHTKFAENLQRKHTHLVLLHVCMSTR